MAAVMVIESVDFSSIDDNGQLTRPCPSPLRVELVSSKHEATVNCYNGLRPSYDRYSSRNGRTVWPVWTALCLSSDLADRESFHLCSASILMHRSSIQSVTLTVLMSDNRRWTCDEFSDELLLPQFKNYIHFRRLLIKFAKLSHFFILIVFGLFK